MGLENALMRHAPLQVHRNPQADITSYGNQKTLALPRKTAKTMNL